MLKAAVRFSRQYVGPVKACILDWSGTTIDKYVLAPAVVFVEVFEKHKVPISMVESRGPMGLRKDLHIKAITEIPEVRERWKSVHGKYPDQTDVDAMFRDFVPMQLAVLGKYSELIPGTPKTIDILRQELGCKIGVTTGFTRCMVDILLAEAKKQGYVPDVNVAGDEVVNGARPKPFMVYRNLDLLDVPDIHSVVKVDDTVAGVGEALSAGCWGVGVARHSNYMDINSLEEEDQIPEEEIQKRLQKSRNLLVQTGAHYVIDTITELPEVVADINARLARGERP
ncbi:phosphonoacetaldehyde hydrolase [Aplysia californica]|uniref:Phosphonoacetaldehyde hydrolase n=1 Tax=Aplysia californica TaxID=6500 RepID=A0ABM1VUG8_APLCA|nr:phosphonoacetaldehyde hydrolase [Aplysia californica]XP_035826060.1 phosphonoacetaldehyde hydrolase [Aplysia californica]